MLREAPVSDLCILAQDSLTLQPDSPALDLPRNQAFSEGEGGTRVAFRGVSPTGREESCEETRGPTGPHEVLFRG